MSGGTTGGGYDLPGVSWTSLFEGDGAAIQSTFWHNNFGEQMSHGCVNAAPERMQNGSFVVPCWLFLMIRET